MKYILLLSACAVMLFGFVVSSNHTSKQFNDTVGKYSYCLVKVYPKFMSAKVNIELDFGDKKGIFEDKRLRNPDNSIRKFNTGIDALNFMDSEGWEFVNSYAVTIGTNETQIHYLLRKHN